MGSSQLIPTNPTEAPEGNMEIYPAVALEFFTLPGSTYQLQQSTDLESWESNGELFLAQGGFQSIFIRQEATAVFWQLVRVDTSE